MSLVRKHIYTKVHTQSIVVHFLEIFIIVQVQPKHLEDFTYFVQNYILKLYYILYDSMTIEVALFATTHTELNTFLSTPNTARTYDTRSQFYLPKNIYYLRVTKYK